MKLNIEAVFNKEKDKILFCFRAKEPYKGKYNFVGGKVEEGEDGLESAYRELFEETGISKDDIVLTHFMDFYYKMSGVELNLYVGRLNKDVELVEEVNGLEWLSVDEDFFDMERFAGEGNIGHMVENIMYYKDKVLA